jgi:hypothetical protein
VCKKNRSPDKEGDQVKTVLDLIKITDLDLNEAEVLDIYLSSLRDISHWRIKGSNSIISTMILDHYPLLLQSLYPVLSFPSHRQEVL